MLCHTFSNTSLIFSAAKLAAAQGIASMPVLNAPVAATIAPSSTNNDGDSSDEAEAEDDTVPAGTTPVNLDHGGAAVPAINGTSTPAKIEDEIETEEDRERKKQLDEEELKRKREEDEKAKELQRQQDRSRPVSSTPVPGTPW